MLQNFTPTKPNAKCLPNLFLDFNETVANPDLEVRSCGRVQNAFKLPLPTSTKLRVNCPVLYMMMKIIKINEN
jgi:hypothetical protein